MPKVHHVKKARKDHGTIVKKGQPYFWWKFRYGGKHVSLTHPRRSQLTQSDKMATIYDAEDEARDAIDNFDDHHSPDAIGELASSLREWAETIRDTGQEYEESIMNMPDSLQESYQAEEMQEKADNAETTASSLDELADNLESLVSDWHSGEYEPHDESEVDRFANDVSSALADGFEEWPH